MLCGGVGLEAKKPQLCPDLPICSGSILSGPTWTPGLDLGHVTPLLSPGVSVSLYVRHLSPFLEFLSPAPIGILTYDPGGTPRLARPWVSCCNGNSRWDVEGVEQLWGQLCPFLSLSCRKVPRLQDFRCVAVLGRGHFGKVALLVGREVCRLGLTPDIRLGAPDVLWPAGPPG